MPPSAPPSRSGCRRSSGTTRRCGTPTRSRPQRGATRPRRCTAAGSRCRRCPTCRASARAGSTGSATTAGRRSSTRPSAGPPRCRSSSTPRGRRTRSSRTCRTSCRCCRRTDTPAWTPRTCRAETCRAAACRGAACRAAAPATSADGGASQLDELRDELAVGHPGRRPAARVHRQGREARHGVDLVDDEPVLGEEAVDACESGAADGVERAGADGPDRRGLVVGQRRGAQQRLVPTEVLRGEVVEAVLGDDDLARQARARHTVAALEHGDLDLAPDDPRFDDHLGVVLERQVHRRRELRGLVDARDAHAGTGTGGLHEQRPAVRRDRAGDPVRVGRPLAPQDRRPRGHPEPGVLEHGLRRVLVHRQGAREHAVADVRQPGDLEEPLDRAVLAERAVQDREHHVHRDRGDRAVRVGDDELVRRRRRRERHARAVVRHGRQRAVTERPLGRVVGLQRERAVLRDADRNDRVRRAVDDVHDAAGGDAADLVLAGPAAEEHGDGRGRGGDRGHGGPLAGRARTGHSPWGSSVSVRCGAMLRGSSLPARTSATWPTMGMSTPFAAASSRIGATDARPSAVWSICRTTSSNRYPWPSRRPAVLFRDSGDWHVAMRSPRPASPDNVEGCAPSDTAKSVISARPRVMIEAFVFSP
ncbi:hypothetical protein Cus16_0037 [Curtobacterium sp. ER1/6]|nr:hypothetical protein Cus16_0037 [Curtobacterium sp. ER1/6]